MREELDACAFFEPDAMANKGHWRSRFASPENPLFLELGCGKGAFASGFAAQNTGTNLLAMDMTDVVLAPAMRKIVKACGENPGNILLTVRDIVRIEDMIAPEDKVCGLFINFCNPWPKHRQQKKRLTHPAFLKRYKSFLEPGAVCRFKTDDPGLYRDSLNYFESEGFELVHKTENLHACTNPAFAGNILTEHEKKFSEQGMPIYAVSAVLR